MNRNSILFILFLFSFSLIIPNCAGIKGSKGRMAPYRQETFTTINGKVDSIDTVFNKIKQEKGLHLTVKTSSGEYIVHVCPQWYADKEQLKFENGELLTISGSTFTKDNEPNIYAATIINGSSKSLNLRNPDTGDGLWDSRDIDDNMPQEQQKEKRKGMLQRK